MKKDFFLHSVLRLFTRKYHCFPLKLFIFPNKANLPTLKLNTLSAKIPIFPRENDFNGLGWGWGVKNVFSRKHKPLSFCLLQWMLTHCNCRPSQQMWPGLYIFQKKKKRTSTFSVLKLLSKNYLFFFKNH